MNRPQSPMDRKLLVILACALVIAGGLYHYQQNYLPTAPLADDSEATADHVASVVGANNRFAIDLYKAYANSTDHRGKNLFLSPYSISVALAMTYEGARGTTAGEMETVLHVPTDAVARRAGHARVHNELNKAGRATILRTANALWAQKAYPFLPDYMGMIERYYAGTSTNLDFSADAEGSRKVINEWVEERTEDRIKDLIPEGALEPATLLVLTNAIYFKGFWSTQFDPDATQDQDFRVTPDRTVKVPMMYLKGKDNPLYYGEGPELQLLEMPYKGEELSMLVLLPRNDDLGALEDSLDAKKLEGIRIGMGKMEVDVYLPRFTFKSKFFMRDTLKGMGMPTAFSNAADFSGMDGSKTLKIDKVIHQAFVEVNEEGTEAAASTAVIMVAKSAGMPRPVFRADHPFIFLIQERATGNVLFLGRVMDPTA